MPSLETVIVDDTVGQKSKGDFLEESTTSTTVNNDNPPIYINFIDEDGEVLQLRAMSGINFRHFP